MFVGRALLPVMGRRAGVPILQMRPLFTRQLVASLFAIPRQGAGLGGVLNMPAEGSRRGLAEAGATGGSALKF